MKRIVTIVSLLLCVAAGVARWLDVVNYTDLTTGFTTQGNYLWRYAVAGILVVLLFLAGFLAPKKPDGLEGVNRIQGVLCAVSGVVFAAAAGMCIASYQTVDLFQLVVGVLYLITGLWMMLVGITRFTEEFEAPSRNAFLGVAGTLSFYLLTIQRFGLSPTGIVRVGSTFAGLAALAVLLFSTAQLKAAYVPDKKNSLWIWFTGMIAFLFATCLSLPNVICLYWVGEQSLFQLIEGIALAMAGLVGASYAAKTMMCKEAE